MKTKKTARELVEQILSDDRGIYYNDASQWGGGPGDFTTEELQVMCDNDSIDDYEIIDAADVPTGLIADTLSAFWLPAAESDDHTGWIIARTQYIQGEDTYTTYLLLWDSEA